ncbi:MAG: nucleotide sugar dehydrogenase [Candidatus Saliniplasma sp.]
MLDKLKRKLDDRDAVVCVVGMGYVGRPLAEYLSDHVTVIGYDIDEDKVERFNRDSRKDLLEFSSDEKSIGKADFVIICVPTPVNESKEPELSFVKSASETVGMNMKKGAVVSYESTVYPGVTEEECVPVLERTSGMKCGEDFYVGYSPERVNPGDKEHTIDKITKVVGGMNEEVGEVLAKLYGLITTVHLTKDIKTAEAAKVIENIQRDLNIALMNELSIIFNKMKLDTDEVLEAAATKWNFHRYHPGLVGGHCIPVDPYYLVYKAKRLDYHPQVILAGRAINDGMPKHVGEMTVKGLNRAGKVIKDSKVVIMGLTYKENVEDVRKSPAKDIVKLLKEYDVDVYGYDPYLSDEKIETFDVKAVDDVQDFDCAVITVAHDEFYKIGADELVISLSDDPVIVDVRGMFKKEDVDCIYMTL